MYTLLRFAVTPVLFGISFFGLSAGANAALVTYYTGSIGGPSGDGLNDPSVVETGAWNTPEGVILGWVIGYDADTQLWTYEYSFDRPTSGAALSHIIIELSTNVTSIGGVTGNVVFDEIRNFEFGENGNPNIPGDIYGVKLNVPELEETDPLVFSFTTDRAPVWGDFYAKDGDPTAWNSGFVDIDPTDPAASGPSTNGHILRPDTVTGPPPIDPPGLPEPTSLAVWCLGMLAAGVGARRLRRSK